MNEEGEKQGTAKPQRLKRALFVFATMIVVVIGVRAWLRWEFPYGWINCSPMSADPSFRDYEADNNNWLPYGKATPEASLSLMCLEDTNNIKWVRGKNISLVVAEAAMKRDGLLGPETCGWHYVEGLHDGDNPDVAVMWDKTPGLGYYGQRRSSMSRQVMLMDGTHHFISTTDWPQFMADQKARLVKIIASRKTNDPPIRWSDEASLGTNWFKASTNSP